VQGLPTQSHVSKQQGLVPLTFCKWEGGDPEYFINVLEGGPCGITSLWQLAVTLAVPCLPWDGVLPYCQLQTLVPIQHWCRLSGAPRVSFSGRAGCSYKYHLEPWAVEGCISFFLSFFYSFIHMCIHCLGHFSPLLPAPSLSPPPHLTSRQNLFCPFLQFFEEMT
jgi:hypothetical protein